MKRAREAAGLTQEELAAKVRVTREYVSRLEREEYSPTIKMLRRICAAIGTPAWEIIRRIESKSAPP